MERKRITLEEEKFITNVYNVSKNILEIYKRLIILEQCGQKDTDEYKKYMGFLATMMDIESEYYSKQPVTLENFPRMCVKLESLMPFEPSRTEFDYIVNQNFDDIAAIRVFFRLVHSNEKDPDVYEMLHRQNPESTAEELQTIVRSHNLIQKDYMVILACLINECINEEGLSSLSNELIKIKYYLSFIYEEVEAQMFKSSFDIRRCELQSEPEIRRLGFNIALSKEAMCKDTAETEVNNVITINNSELMELRKQVELEIRKCSLRSVFTLMRPGTFDIMSKSILNFINKQSGTENSISLASIKECISKNPKDRSKVSSYKPTQK